MPHLAATYAMKIFSAQFATTMSDFNQYHLTGDNENSSADLGIEIHALSSATKPLCSWTARDALQDCRESCGGHGYMKSKSENVHDVI